MSSNHRHNWYGFILLVTAVIGVAYMMTWAVAGAVLTRTEQARTRCVAEKGRAACAGQPDWEKKIRRYVFALGPDR